MSIQSYLIASIDYIDTSTRQLITNPDSFLIIREAIGKARDRAKLEPLKGAEIVTELLSTAMSNNATLDFFQLVSEMRSEGKITEIAQTQAAARIGLIFYYEKIMGGSNYGQLRDFINHANAIKSDTIDMITAIKNEDIKFYKSGVCAITKKTLIDNQNDIIDMIDSLIVSAGQSSENNEMHILNGTQHALVASYMIYGDISKASDIVMWSSSVGGVNINDAKYISE